MLCYGWHSHRQRGIWTTARRPATPQRLPVGSTAGRSRAEVGRQWQPTGSVSTWAMLNKWVSNVDPLECPHYHGQLQISFIQRGQHNSYVIAGCGKPRASWYWQGRLQPDHLIAVELLHLRIRLWNEYILVVFADRAFVLRLFLQHLPIRMHAKGLPRLSSSGFA